MTELGLNDVLVFPLLVIVASLTLAESAPTSSVQLRGWGSLIFTQLAFGPLVGIAIDWFGARLTDHAINRNEVLPRFYGESRR